ncbi:serine/arginine repetitive matrix protein 2-like [Papilio machaon]|uniref:serine/arginine repetitive matrix protein 2-like n=1 Tax=Papilio machaon TaxID=76193 RepID=UPI001E663693|nr:serine/arginine repetitive matrix protein 2-like [Papilio machaon]
MRATRPVSTPLTKAATQPGPLRSVLGPLLSGARHGGLAARLQPTESVAFMARVHHVTVDRETSGELLLSDRCIHFVPEWCGEEGEEGAEGEGEGSSCAAQSWALGSVSRVCPRRWCLQERAAELFLLSGHAHLLAFAATAERDAFLRALDAAHLPNRTEQESLSDVMNQWRNGTITNWEYLMALNGLAGRSYNDLMQYPVLPFIIADYTSKMLDLHDPASFRDLSKPMAVQNKKREQHYINTYNDLKAARREGCSPLLSRQPHHYASLYSNSGGVLHYLVRVPPFTELFLNYQDNNFDMPDRTFHSLATTWRLITHDSPTDVKELIPELFYLPEMFYNDEGLELGVRQCGARVDAVELPRWAADARLFTLAHRQALEAPLVTERLPHWIDLVFGYKQTGQAAVDAINVFPACTYYGFDPSVHEDEVDRTAAQAMVRTYGQAPRQLLRAPHPHAAPDLAPRTQVHHRRAHTTRAHTTQLCLLRAPHPHPTSRRAHRYTTAALTLRAPTLHNCVYCAPRTRPRAAHTGTPPPRSHYARPHYTTVSTARPAPAPDLAPRTQVHHRRAHTTRAHTTQLCLLRAPHPTSRRAHRYTTAALTLRAPTLHNCVYCAPRTRTRPRAAHTGTPPPRSHYARPHYTTVSTARPAPDLAPRTQVHHRRAHTTRAHTTQLCLLRAPHPHPTSRRAHRYTTAALTLRAPTLHNCVYCAPRTRPRAAHTGTPPPRSHYARPHYTTVSTARPAPDLAPRTQVHHRRAHTTRAHTTQLCLLRAPHPHPTSRRAHRYTTAALTLRAPTLHNCVYCAPRTRPRAAHTGTPPPRSHYARPHYTTVSTARPAPDLAPRTQVHHRRAHTTRAHTTQLCLLRAPHPTSRRAHRYTTAALTLRAPTLHNCVYCAPRTRPRAAHTGTPPPRSHYARPHYTTVSTARPAPAPDLAPRTQVHHRRAHTTRAHTTQLCLLRAPHAAPDLAPRTQVHHRRAHTTRAHTTQLCLLRAPHPTSRRAHRYTTAALTLRAPTLHNCVYCAPRTRPRAAHTGTPPPRSHYARPHYTTVSTARPAPAPDLAPRTQVHHRRAHTTRAHTTQLCLLRAPHPHPTSRRAHRYTTAALTLRAPTLHNCVYCAPRTRTRPRAAHTGTPPPRSHYARPHYTTVSTARPAPDLAPRTQVHHRRAHTTRAHTTQLCLLRAPHPTSRRAHRYTTAALTLRAPTLHNCVYCAPRTRTRPRAAHTGTPPPRSHYARPHYTTVSTARPAPDLAPRTQVHHRRAHTTRAHTTQLCLLRAPHPHPTSRRAHRYTTAALTLRAPTLHNCVYCATRTRPRAAHTGTPPPRSHYARPHYTTVSTARPAPDLAPRTQVHHRRAHTTRAHTTQLCLLRAPHPTSRRAHRYTTAALTLRAPTLHNCVYCAPRTRPRAAHTGTPPPRSHYARPHYTTVSTARPAPDLAPRTQVHHRRAHTTRAHTTQLCLLRAPHPTSRRAHRYTTAALTLRAPTLHNCVYCAPRTRPRAAHTGTPPPRSHYARPHYTTVSTARPAPAPDLAPRTQVHHRRAHTTRAHTTQLCLLRAPHPTSRRAHRYTTAALTLRAPTLHNCVYCAPRTRPRPRAAHTGTPPPRSHYARPHYTTVSTARPAPDLAPRTQVHHRRAHTTRAHTTQLCLLRAPHPTSRRAHRYTTAALTLRAPTLHNCVYCAPPTRTRPRAAHTGTPPPRSHYARPHYTTVSTARPAPAPDLAPRTQVHHRRAHTTRAHTTQLCLLRAPHPTSRRAHRYTTAALTLRAPTLHNCVYCAPRTRPRAAHTGTPPPRSHYARPHYTTVSTARPAPDLAPRTQVHHRRAHTTRAHTTQLCLLRAPHPHPTSRRAHRYTTAALTLRAPTLHNCVYCAPRTRTRPRAAHTGTPPPRSHYARPHYTTVSTARPAPAPDLAPRTQVHHRRAHTTRAHTTQLCLLHVPFLCRQTEVMAGVSGVRWGRYCGSPELGAPAVAARRQLAGAARLVPLPAPHVRTAVACAQHCAPLPFGR